MPPPPSFRQFRLSGTFIREESVLLYRTLATLANERKPGLIQVWIVNTGSAEFVFDDAAAARAFFDKCCDGRCVPSLRAHMMTGHEYAQLEKREHE